MCIFIDFDIAAISGVAREEVHVDGFAGGGFARDRVHFYYHIYEKRLSFQASLSCTKTITVIHYAYYTRAQ